MQRNWSRVVLWAALTAAILPSTPSASGEFSSAPNVADVLNLRDGVCVTLDSLIVENLFGPYLFTRDPHDWEHVLPVYANTYIERWGAIEVSGCTTTVAGKRILIADRIRVYEDALGKPFLLFPGNAGRAYQWP